MTVAFGLGKAVRSAAVVDIDEAVMEPETELFSRDLLPSSHGTQLSRLQTLERLKGDLDTALRDLELDSDSDISVSGYRLCWQTFVALVLREGERWLVLRPVFDSCTSQ